MFEHKKLDLSSLNYADEFLSYDEAISNKKPFDYSAVDFSEDGIFKIEKAEKNYESKCVKFKT